jgi:hypothetical protein
MSAELRAKRYKELCREAAKQLGCKASDEIAVHCATLRLCRETFAARLIAGRDVDPNALLKLDEALREFMRQFQPAKQHTVKFEYVEGNPPAELPEALRRPQTHPAANRTSDREDATTTPSNEASSTPPSVPESKPPEKLFEPAHDFHAGAPLRNGNEPWRHHVAVGGWSLTPEPRYLLHQPGHPLPSPKYGSGS